MAYLSFLCLFLLLHLTAAVNVTFTPQMIYLTTADLPQPNISASVNKPANVVSVPANASLYVPSGFTVKLYMADLVLPRYLIYTPSGDILVSEPRVNRISCLIDADFDGHPDQRVTFADATNGLNSPYGMAFANNYFYVGNTDSLRRYPWTEGSRNITGTGEVLMSYDGTGHSTRTVLISPNNQRLFVSIGSASNVNVEALPRASIQHANLDGTNQSTYAYGLRNAVGLDFHPVTNALYVSCQERDGLGDDLVPDYFTHVQQDDFFGWPYAYLSPNMMDPRRTYENGTSERPDLVAATQTPDVLFQAHSAVLDIRFYTGNQFPSRYQNGVFAAFHGSWNRNNGTGYKIVFIPFNATSNQPLGYYEDFVYGFLTNPTGPDTFGRPVGLLVLKDGSLLFTEDGNNRIYQVQYNGAIVDTENSTSSSSTTTVIAETTTIEKDLTLTSATTSTSATIINATVIVVTNSTTSTTRMTTMDTILTDSSTSSTARMNTTLIVLTNSTSSSTTAATSIVTVISTSTTGDAATTTAAASLVISLIVLEYIFS